jgi:hypothetical protein
MWRVRAALVVMVAAAAIGPLYPKGAEKGREADLQSPLTTLLEHRQNQAARAARGLPDLTAAAVRSGDPGRVNVLALPDQGNISVVDNGDGVALPALEFDLDNQTLRFLPSDGAASAYSYEVEAAGYDAAAAAQGEDIALGDDDSAARQLPFAFPFFGQSYGEIFVNSDGNLTFVEGDAASTLRSAARAVSGPPRICGFFTDLDPSQELSAVRMFSSAERVVFSWIRVPEWTPDGLGRRQDFQIALFADGRIAFAYAGITTGSGIVGIAPAVRLELSVAVDFSVPPEATYDAAVVEIFEPALLDLGLLGQKFYLTHDDVYDYLVIFHNYDIGIDLGNTFASYRGIRNFTRGVGPNPIEAESLNLFDFGEFFGSGFRLQGLMFMGDLSKYPDDPRERIDRDFGLGIASPLTVLAHEAGHRYLAHALFVDPQSRQLSLDLLGRQIAHWSYFFNSEASLLEGNRIVDHGSGDFRFETVATVEGFSSLDRYLMGLIPAEQVPPSFIVRNPSIGDELFNASHAPLAGIFFNGERVDLTMDMILEAHGRRSPDHTVSQKNYRFAFVLLVEEGFEPPPEQIEKLDRFRTEFEEYFEQASGGIATVETELVYQLTLSTWPAAGVRQGASLPAAVVLAFPEREDLTVRLVSEKGLAGVPESVTIPAGEAFAEFTIEGRDSGVDHLTAEAGDGFEVGHSNIQVLASPAGLSAQRILPLEILFNDPRERLRTGEAGKFLPYGLFFHVADANQLYYQGIRVKLTASGDGVVEPAEAETDSFGFVSASWRLATEPGPNQLRVEIEGSEHPPLVLDAVGVRNPPRLRDPFPFIFGP